jgi:hypothetical protein
LFDSETLHKRWRVSEHPLYEKTMQDMGLAGVPVTLDNTVSQESDEDLMRIVLDKDRMAVYNSIYYPERQERRYHMLNQAATEVASLGCSKDKHAYKMAMIGLNALKLQITTRTVDNVPVVGSLPPARHDCSNEDNNNLSALVRKSQKRRRTCHHCVSVNRPEDALGHRTGGNCPNKHILVPAPPDIL